MFPRSNQMGCDIKIILVTDSYYWEGIGHQCEMKVSTYWGIKCSRIESYCMIDFDEFGIYQQ